MATPAFSIFVRGYDVKKNQKGRSSCPSRKSACLLVEGDAGCREGVKKCVLCEFRGHAKDLAVFRVST